MEAAAVVLNLPWSGGADPLRDTVWSVAWGVGAWLWGSYLNQVADRIPRADGSFPGLNASGLGVPARPTPLHPARSFCYGCGRRLSWYENVPLLSYVALRGRCRRCGAEIGRRTFVVEAATPTLLLAWLWLWQRNEMALPELGWGGALISWLVLLAVLLAESRRRSALFWLAGALIAAGSLAAAAWQ